MSEIVFQSAKKLARLIRAQAFRPRRDEGINLELSRWLSWYNSERSCCSLAEPVAGRKTARLLSPVQFLAQFHQCKVCWPCTAG